MKIQDLTPEPQILAELGRRLAQMRKQQRMTQITLAEEAGIGVATLRRIESGQDSQMETWLKILKALRQISAVDLLLPENYASPMTKALSQGRGRRGNQSRTNTQGASESVGTPWKTEDDEQ